jgi:hypothetical protein
MLQAPPLQPLVQGPEALPRWSRARGAALGALITLELAKSTDVHPSRAIIRTLQRPLSVLINQVSAMLMPILPRLSAGYTPGSSSGPVSHLAHAHALGIARFVAELLERWVKQIDNAARDCAQVSWSYT